MRRIEIDTFQLDQEFEEMLDEMYYLYHCHPTHIPDYDRIAQEQEREAWKHVNDAYPAEGWHYHDNLEELKAIYSGLGGSEPVEPEPVEPEPVEPEPEPVIHRKLSLFNKPITWKSALVGAVLFLAVYALMLFCLALVNGAIEYLVVGVLK